MSEKNTTERWTIADQIERQRAQQAWIRLEGDVRRMARQNGASQTEASELAEKARITFRIVNGEARLMEADGKTARRGDDGALVAVADWVGRNCPSKDKPAGTMGPSPVALPVKKKNPFKRGSWNLTEQMLLRRRDPELAARLLVEAEG